MLTSEKLSRKISGLINYCSKKAFILWWHINKRQLGGAYFRIGVCGAFDEFSSGEIWCALGAVRKQRQIGDWITPPWTQTDFIWCWYPGHFCSYSYTTWEDHGQLPGYSCQICFILPQWTSRLLMESHPFPFCRLCGSSEADCLTAKMDTWPRSGGWNCFISQSTANNSEMSTWPKVGQ